MPCPACGAQWQSIGPGGGVCPSCGPIPRAALDSMPRDGQRPSTLVAAQVALPLGAWHKLGGESAAWQLPLLELEATA